MLHKNIPNIPHIFRCEVCDYECSKKSIYTQHISTTKHQNATSMLQHATKNICECGKQFQHHSSYYRHKKKCKIENIQQIDENKKCNEQEEEPEILL